MTTDLFSKQAQLYSQFRPQYPQELYDFLLKLCPAKDLAWDCATGNGQAASDLAKHFKKVIATDISESQIKNAVREKNIEYRVLRAEQALDLPAGSVDLVTVAQALHWFDLDLFYAEVKRLLRPSGVFATWAYSFHAPISPEIDAILKDFYLVTLGPYWKPNNKLIWDRYKDLSFPFQEVTVPEIFIQVTWSLEDLIGYLRTWSATQLFVDKNKVDPTTELHANLLPLWGGENKKKHLRWDLVLKVGRIFPTY